MKKPAGGGLLFGFLSRETSGCRIRYDNRSRDAGDVRERDRRRIRRTTGTSHDQLHGGATGIGVADRYRRIAAYADSAVETSVRHCGQHVAGVNHDGRQCILARHHRARVALPNSECERAGDTRCHVGNDERAYVTCGITENERRRVGGARSSCHSHSHRVSE